MSNLLISAQQSRAASLEAVEAILAKAETEKRTLTDDETGALRGHKAEVKRFDEQITLLSDIPAQRRAGAQIHNNQEDRPWGDETRGLSVGADFFRSVVQAEKRDGAADPRLFKRASGLNEAIGSEGGFLVPETISNELMERSYSTGAYASRCSAQPMSNPSIVIPALNESSRVDGSRGGGVRAYWAAEAATVTASKPDFRRIRLELKKLMALCYATDELLMDATALEAYIRRAFPQEMAFVIDDAIVRGDGNGKPLGYLNSAALVTVSKEAGPQTADTVVMANIVKMWTRMWAPSRANAAWFMGQDIEAQLYQMATSSSSPTPVFLPPGGLSGAPYSTLFGRPIIVNEQSSAIGDLGDIALLDLSQYILARSSAGVKADSSMHVRFLYDEMTFRFTTRVDGQPWWNAALTPYKGSSTLSPFVTLEAR
jgi:HK97 family phage major capsid protein